MAAVLRQRHRSGLDFRRDAAQSTVEYRRWDAFQADSVRETLVRQAQETFDKQHEQVLCDLWSLAFPTDLYEGVSAQWRKLGFQSDDPTRDLRGAGCLGLRQLHAFFATVGSSFNKDHAHTGFPLALASLSVTAMLCRYLELNRTLIISGCSEPPIASDAVKRSFFELSARSSGGHDVLQRMHCRLLIHLAHRWAAMKTPETTIMNFPAALRATYIHLHRALTILPCPWTLSGMLSSLDRESIDEWQDAGACMGTNPFVAFYTVMCVLVTSFSRRGGV